MRTKEAWFALVLVLLTSCGASASFERDVSERERMDVSVSEVRGMSIFDLSSWTMRSSIDSRYKAVIYDTSLPVDEKTGRCPVAAEVEIGSRSTGECDADSQREVHSETELVENVSEQHETEIHTEADAEAKVSTMATIAAYIIVTAVMLCVKIFIK